MVERLSRCRDMPIEDESFAREVSCSCRASRPNRLIARSSSRSLLIMRRTLLRSSRRRTRLASESEHAETSMDASEATRCRAVLFANDAASGVGPRRPPAAARDFRRKLVRNIEQLSTVDGENGGVQTAAASTAACLAAACWAAACSAASTTTALGASTAAARPARRRLLAQRQRRGRRRYDGEADAAAASAEPDQSSARVEGRVRRPCRRGLDPKPPTASEARLFDASLG